VNIRSIYYGIGSNILGNVVMLLATLWLTRILDPQQFGQFRVGSSFATLMIPFLALGSERLVSRMLQNRKGGSTSEISSVITVSFAVVLVSSVVLAASYPLLSPAIFKNQVPSSVYFVSILLIPATIAYNLSNTIWRHTESTVAAQVHLNLTQRLWRGPLLIGFSSACSSALSASLAMLLAQTLSLFQIHRHLKPFKPRSPQLQSLHFKSNLKQLATIGIPVAIMAAIDRLDILLINATMGVEAAGTYDIIYMLSLTAMFPAMAMSKTSEPFLYNLKLDIDRQNSIKQLQSRTLITSFIAVLGVAIAGPILQGFLGNAGTDFSSAALVLSAGLAFSSVHGPVIEYLQINGKTKITLITVLAMLTGFFILKYTIANTGSLTSFAALAGLFYFALRAALASYIRLKDGVEMSSKASVLTSSIMYVAITIYIITQAR